MQPIKSTLDTEEIARFAQNASGWWDNEGPFKTLHDINAVRLELIRKHCPLKGMKVLDVGCGGGILAEAMAQAGASVTGIDAEPDAIKTARAHATQSGLSIQYHCSVLESFNTQGFDVLTCMEMFEHVSNPVLVLEHCKRVLKPGGIFFASTLNRSLKAYALAIIAAEYLLKLLPKQTHDYSKFIRPSELMGWARRLDFNLLDLQGMSYNPFTRIASLSKDVSVNYLVAFRSS